MDPPAASNLMQYRTISAVSAAHPQMFRIARAAPLVDKELAKTTFGGRHRAALRPRRPVSQVEVTTPASELFHSTAAEKVESGGCGTGTCSWPPEQQPRSTDATTA